MPIYEYRCGHCAQITSVFHRTVASSQSPACTHCGSEAMTRTVSMFATPKTEQQVLEQFGTPAPGAGPEAYRDPRQIGRWVEQRFDEMGVELPDEARTMIDAARDGDLPAPIQDL